MALWRSTAGLRPEIVPSSVLKMNRATPDMVPFETRKPAVPVKTTPVGAAVVPAGLPPGGGIVTTSRSAGERGGPAPVLRAETTGAFAQVQAGAGPLRTQPPAVR